MRGLTPLPDKAKNYTHEINLTQNQYDNYVNRSFFKMVNGNPEPKTVAELNAQATEVQDKIRDNKINELWNAAYSYQVRNIDQNLDREFMFARNLVRFNGATDADFPSCVALRNWIQSIWGMPSDPPSSATNATYYARKNAILADQDYSLEFSDFDPVPTDYQTVLAEITAFEASI